MKRRTRLEMFKDFLIDFRNHGNDKRHSKRLFEGIKKYAPELTQWILQHSFSHEPGGPDPEGRYIALPLKNGQIEYRDRTATSPSTKYKRRWKKKVKLQQEIRSRNAYFWVALASALSQTDISPQILRRPYLDTLMFQEMLCVHIQEIGKEKVKGNSTLFGENVRGLQEEFINEAWVRVYEFAETAKDYSYEDLKRESVRAINALITKEKNIKKHYGPRVIDLLEDDD